MSENAFSLDAEVQLSIDSARVAGLKLQRAVERVQRLSRVPTMETEISHADGRVGGAGIELQRSLQIRFGLFESAHPQEDVSTQLPGFRVVRVTESTRPTAAPRTPSSPAMAPEAMRR